MTAAAELALIDTAITSLLAGGAQSYSTQGGGGGQSVTKLSYEQLVARKNQLEASIARASSGSFAAVQFRRSE